MSGRTLRATGTVAQINATARAAGQNETLH